MKLVGSSRLTLTKSLGWQTPRPFFKRAAAFTFRQSLRDRGQETARMSGYSLIDRFSLLTRESLAVPF
jgi:hypothetical protein